MNAHDQTRRERFLATHFADLSPARIESIPGEFRGMTAHEILEAALDLAVTKESNAAHAGARDDGGAGAFCKRVRFWLDGLLGQLPEDDDLGEIVVNADRLRNPEDYETYLRLKERFETT